MARQLFQPRLSEDCLCGSGQKFRDCCCGKLEGLDMGKAYRAATRDEDLPKALLACRADIVQYTIWHRTNTVPVLSAVHPLWEMLRIDVDALGDLVDRLRMLYFALDRLTEFPEVLERLRSNIAWPAWQRKISFFRALYFLAPPADVFKARAELAKAEPITVDDEDLDIVELKYDIGLEGESLSVQMAYVERLIAERPDLESQMRYRASKAVRYFAFGDKLTTERELAKLIEVADEHAAESPLTDEQLFRLTRYRKFLAQLKRDKSGLVAARDVYRTLLVGDRWKEPGRLEIYREIGDCSKHLSLWSDAEVAFLEAIAFEAHSIDQIRLAEALAYQGKIVEALDEIDKVEPQSLDLNEREDFVFVYGALAVLSGSVNRLSISKELLGKLVATAPYFNERRLELLLAITETIARGAPSAAAKEKIFPLEGTLSAANSIFMVQPNIMGFGVNFNAVFDKLFKLRARSSKGRRSQ